MNKAAPIPIDFNGAAIAPIALHASAVVVGEAGVLIRGPSGAGKSRLCLALLERADACGIFARLVGDDRLRLAAAHGRLLIEGHPAIAGRIERRGHGIVAMPFATTAVTALVVDLEMGMQRLPEACDTSIAILGLDLPRMSLASALPVHEQVSTVLAALQRTIVFSERL